MDNHQIAFIKIDEHGTIVECNDDAPKITGDPKKEIEFYFWIHSAFRRYVKVIMDIILMGLVFVSFILFIKTIYLMGISLYNETNIAHVISEIIFIFILAETVRLLIISGVSQSGARCNG
jgi:hypothetical protein